MEFIAFYVALRLVEALLTKFWAQNVNDSKE